MQEASVINPSMLWFWCFKDLTYLRSLIKDATVSLYSTVALTGVLQLCSIVITDTVHTYQIMVEWIQYDSNRSAKLQNHRP